LENIHYQLVLLRCEEWLDLDRADLEEPRQVTVLVLVLVEHVEGISARLHRGRDGARQVAVDWPVATREHFSAKVHSADCVASLQFEFLLQILAQLDVGEHLRHLVDSVQPALHLEFLKHGFLSFVREECLIKKTSGEQLRISLDEHVSSMKAAEEAHDGIETSLSILVVDSLETDLQFFVRELGNIARRLVLRVHEVLERSIAAFLELHIILEALLNQLVHLFL
jgi:hypothetical protein